MASSVPVFLSIVRRSVGDDGCDIALVAFWATCREEGLCILSQGCFSYSLLVPSNVVSSSFVREEKCDNPLAVSYTPFLPFLQGSVVRRRSHFLRRTFRL